MKRIHGQTNTAYWKKYNDIEEKILIGCIQLARITDHWCYTILHEYTAYVYIRDNYTLVYMSFYIRDKYLLYDNI